MIPINPRSVATWHLTIIAASGIPIARS